MNNYKFTYMKKFILIYLALTCMGTGKSVAQEQTREKLEAYRIAFFTKRLNLTPQEAEKFWPVYNEFQDKKNQIQAEKGKINRNFNQNELNMSEKEMIEAGDRYIALEVQGANLTQEYHSRFKEILSPVKVLRLYQAENQYRIQLLQELKQNPQIRNNIRKGPGGGGLQQPQ
jgi:hypothetical protein